MCGEFSHAIDALNLLGVKFPIGKAVLRTRSTAAGDRASEKYE
jgi:hypothetical protein